MNKQLEKICKLFDAVVEPSQRRLRRITELNYNNLYEPNELTSSISNIPDVEMIAIHIPKDRLNLFIEAFDEQSIKEITLRTSVPAIEKAYRQYKTLIYMCKSTVEKY